MANGQLLFLTLIICNKTLHLLSNDFYTMVSIYCIRTNIGEELNLAKWRIATQTPSLNLANIFL